MNPLVYSVLFFLSGFAGLLYQIVWLHMAFTHFGIITPVLSVVISVFMLGLGCGSWVAGRGIDRWTRPGTLQPLVVYGAIEGLTGLLAFAVPHFFDWGETLLLQGGAMDSLRYLGSSAIIITLALFPACFCMGMTYPVMMAHLRRVRQDNETSFSFLYGANVLGAFLGASLTTLVLIECLGFRKTLWIGVDASALTACLSLYLSQRIVTRPISVDEKSEPLVRAPASSPSAISVALLMTGFISMAYEVLWTRAFTPVLGTTAYAFAAVVSVYLASTWVGTLFYRRDVRQSHFRALPPLYGALTITALLPVVMNDPRWNLNGGVVLFSLAPFCGLLGYVTPLLVDRYARGHSREAGRAYAINIVGCVVGPLIASYAILPFYGSREAMIGLSIPLLILCAATVEKSFAREKRIVWLVGALLVMSGSLFCHSYEDRCPDASSARPVIRRDYAAIVLSCGAGMKKRLFVNGIGITYLTPLTKMMAHMPVFCHRGTPKTALTICFGMGTTYRSLLSWGMKTTAVELVPSVKDAFGYYFDDAPMVLRDPNGTIVIDDGRRFLKRTTERYDIITLDPPPPVEATGSGLLYSREFYELLKVHMQPDGILQQWWPGGELKIFYAVAHTLQQEFPYVRVYKGLGDQGFHFLCSMQPITVPTLSQAMARMTPKVRQDFLEWNPGWSLLPLMQPIFAREIPMAKLTLTPDLVTDDEPYNEYYILRRLKDGSRSGGKGFVD